MNRDPIDKEDVANAMRHIQGHEEAMKMSAMITDRLCDLPEITVIPERLYRSIAEVVAEFYALGYVKGMRDRP